MLYFINFLISWDHQFPLPVACKKNKSQSLSIFSPTNICQNSIPIRHIMQNSNLTLNSIYSKWAFKSCLTVQGLQLFQCPHKLLACALLLPKTWYLSITTKNVPFQTVLSYTVGPFLLAIGNCYYFNFLSPHRTKNWTGSPLFTDPARSGEGKNKIFVTLGQRCDVHTGVILSAQSKDLFIWSWLPETALLPETSLPSVYMRIASPRQSWPYLINMHITLRGIFNKYVSSFALLSF